MNDRTEPTRPEEIRAQMSELRQRLDHRLELLEEKLDPRPALDQAWTTVRDDGMAAAGRAVKSHPVPAALIGAGLTWLAAEAILDDDDVDEDLLNVVHTRRHTAPLPRAGIVSTTVDDGVTVEMQPEDEKASTLRKVRRKASKAVRRSVRAARSNPLTTAALTAIAGACAGLAVPSSRLEDKVMGGTSDDLIDNARAGARDLVHDGEEVVRHAASAAGESVRSEAPNASDFTEAVRNVVRSTGEAAEQEAKRRGIMPSDLSAKAESKIDEVTTLGCERPGV